MGVDPVSMGSESYETPSSIGSTAWAHAPVKAPAATVARNARRVRRAGDNGGLCGNGLCVQSGLCLGCGPREKTGEAFRRAGTTDSRTAK